VGLDGEHRRLVKPAVNRSGVSPGRAYVSGIGASLIEGWRFFIRQENFMPTSRADVATEHASRYLQQLCRHWSHKFPVEFDPQHGAIQLSIGRTVMDADDQALHIALAADDEASLERLESVVADHIKRFAFREELAFDWRKAA
jgi:hypothetical protein